MLGNCAAGKLRTVSEPTSTMTMEITMATMGRLMKNFDMDHRSLSTHRALASRSLAHDPWLIDPWLLLRRAWDSRARPCAFFEPPPLRLGRRDSGRSR